MSGRAREWRARVLLALLSSAVALGFAEVATRILLRPGPSTPIQGTPISEISPTLGWRARPGGSQRIRREDFDVTVSINARGLRGPELPYEAAAGRRRLAILGDSFAHGYYAEEADTVAGRLRSALAPCAVDVVNGGGPGYSTDQEWMFYNEEIARYAPREVVVLFYYNDLFFNIDATGTANRPKPVFEERDGHLVLVPPRVTPETSSATTPSAAIAREAPTFRGSVLWASLALRLQRARPDWSRELAARGLAPDLSADPPGEYLPFGAREGEEAARVEAMWRRTRELLRAFRDDVRKSGAGFSVFYVPARFEANDEAWAWVQRRYEAPRPWRRDAVRSRLGRLLNELDVPLFDADAAFGNAERGKDPAYLPVDGHWNATGHRVAFEALYPAMRRVFACAR